MAEGDSLSGSPPFGSRYIEALEFCHAAGRSGSGQVEGKKSLDGKKLVEGKRSGDSGDSGQSPICAGEWSFLADAVGLRLETL